MSSPEAITDTKESIQVSTPTNKSSSWLDLIALFLIAVVGICMPFFFIPHPAVPLLVAKSFFMVVGVIGASVLFLIARLKDGVLVLPRSTVLYAGISITIVSVISSIVSGQTDISLFGSGTEFGSALTTIIGSLILVLTASIVRTGKTISILGYGILTGLALLTLVFFLRLFFGPDFLSFGVFNAPMLNPVGKWNDLGIVFGAGIIALVSLIEYGAPTKLRLGSFILLPFLVLALYVVNMPLLFIVTGSFTALMVVIIFSTIKTPNRRKIAIPAIVVAVLLFGGYFLENRTGDFLAKKFSIGEIEARPSWGSSVDISLEALKDNPIFGTGPNLLTNVWLSAKPIDVNQTIFWNLDFNYLIGAIPTLFATTGILGILSWIFFVITLFFLGVRIFFGQGKESQFRFVAVSAFASSVFVLTMSFVYIPTTSIIVLGFYLAGLSIAGLVISGGLKDRIIPFGEKIKTNLAVSSLLLIILVVSGWVGVVSFRRALGVVDLVRANRAYQAGSIESSTRLAEHASSFGNSDTSERFLSELALIELNRFLTTPNPSLSQEALFAQLSDHVRPAIDHAQKAISRNPKNYQNYITLGRVYESLVPLKIIENAYDFAKEQYEKAKSINPSSPAIPLTLARLEVVKGNRSKAKEFIADSLRLKSNYTEAVFLLSQIEADEGNIKGAIRSAEAAAVLAPNDPAVFFQVGLLKYNDRAFEGAVRAFERAVGLNPSYANAKYFLGLSYDRINRRKDAIVQFEELIKTNSDNEEIKLILKNLTEGRQPFANAEPPIDSQPEKRQTPPLVEKKDNVKSGGIQNSQ